MRCENVIVIASVMIMIMLMISQIHVAPETAIWMVYFDETRCTNLISDDMDLLPI